MADEQLYRGIVAVETVGVEQAQADLLRFTQQLATQMQAMGQIGGSSNIGASLAADLGKAEDAAERLLRVQTQMRQQLVANAGADPGVQQQLRALDALILKTEQLRRVQALPPVSDTSQNAVIARQTEQARILAEDTRLRTGGNVYGEGLAGYRRESAVNTADTRVVKTDADITKGQAELAAAMQARLATSEKVRAADEAVAAAQRRLAAAAAQAERSLENQREINSRPGTQYRVPRITGEAYVEGRRAQLELDAATERRAALTGASADADMKVLEAQQRIVTAELARARAAEGADLTRQAGLAGAAKADEGFRINPDDVLDEARGRVAGTYDALLEAQTRELAASERLAVVSNRKYKDESQGFAAIANAEAARQAATKRLAAAQEAHAAAEAKAAVAVTAADEARRIQGDPRRGAILGENGDAFLASQGIEPEGGIRSQQLGIEQKRLEASRRSLISKLAATNSEEQYERLIQQRVALESRIRANTGAMERARYTESGRGGFVGGLIGNFDGSPQGVSRADIGFQAGQAAKFYALYTGMSLVQQALTGLITLSAEYSLVVSDLAIAMNTSTDVAEKAAEGYARIGAEYGTGPLESLQGAAKFARTFRDEDQQPIAGAGDQGAKIASYINILEGPQRIEKVMQDLIALMGAYNQGPEGATRVYDEAQSISQRYGFQAGEVMGGAGVLGDLGKESGYDLPELVALIASVMQATGTTGDAVAGDVKRILGSQDSTDLNGVFERFNIDLNQNFEERIFQLATVFDAMPEAQRSREITGIANDPRTGASFAAMISTALQARETVARAGDSAGLVDKQVAQRLGEFGGELKKLQANLTQAAIALGDVGIVDLLTTIAHAFNGMAGALVLVANTVGLIPDPLLEGAAALGLFLIAARGVAALRTAFEGNAILSGLTAVPGSSGRAARREIIAERNATVSDLTARRTAALAGGQFALSASLTGQIAATERAAAAATGLTARMSGFAAATAGAVGPLAATAAIMAAFTVAGDAKSQLETYDQAIAGGKAQDKILDQPVTDRKAYENALQQMEAERKKVLKTDDGIAGWFIKGGPFQPGSIAEGTRWDVAGQLEAQAKQFEERIKAGQEALRAYDERVKATGTPAASGSEYFGDDYRLTTYRIEQIKQQGMGPEAATGRLQDLISGGNLDRMFPKVQGEKGLEEFMKVIVDRIQQSTNPLEQQGDFALLRNTISQLSGVAGGGSDNADAARMMIEQANKLYLDSLISNTEAKIANIKSLQGKGTSSLNSIRGLIREALKSTTGAGDISATVKLLGLVDKQFLDSFRTLQQAQITILRNQLKAIQEAGKSAAVAAAFAREARMDPGIEGMEVDPSAIGRNAVNEAQQRAVEEQIKAYEQSLKTLESAAGQTNFTGSAFEWPKGGAGDGPTAQEIEMARIASTATPGDSLQNAKVNLKLAEYQLANAKDDREYYDALKAVNEAKYALSQGELDLATAIVGAGALAGDSYSQAIANVKIANKVLAAAVGKTEYWTALKGLRDAQYELAVVELEAANNARLLRIDITDPVAQARAAVEAAKAKLAFDQKRGASSSVITADKVDLRQAQASAASTAWNQQFGDMQTNYDLQRMSLTAYLKYLNTQRTYLLAVKNKTRDQVEQLNQVDRALQGLADSLQGQWNLGDIRMPTPYEVRSAMAGNQAALTTNNITINGADTVAVMAMLQNLLGVATIQSASTASSKV